MTTTSGPWSRLRKERPPFLLKSLFPQATYDSWYARLDEVEERPVECIQHQFGGHLARRLTVRIRRAKRVISTDVGTRSLCSISLLL
jgi:hypothetical protein